MKSVIVFALIGLSCLANATPTTLSFSQQSIVIAMNAVQFDRNSFIDTVYNTFAMSMIVEFRDATGDTFCKEVLLHSTEDGSAALTSVSPAQNCYSLKAKYGRVF